MTQAIRIYRDGYRCALVGRVGHKWAEIITFQHPVKAQRVPVGAVEGAEELAPDEAAALRQTLIERAERQHPDGLPKRLEEALS